MENGQIQVRDMRQAGTPLGNNRFSFSFTDKNVKEF